MYDNRNWLIWTNILTDMLMIVMVAYGFISDGIGLSTIAAALAALGVIGLAYGKVWAFPFNMLQNVLWFFIAWQSKFFADCFMAIFYFLTQLVLGLPYFKKNRTNGDNLRVKRTNKKSLVLFAVIFFVFSLVAGAFSYFMGGEQIILDTTNNATAVASQIFQMNGSQLGNWGWMVTDVLTLIQYGISYVEGNTLAFGAIVQTAIQTVNGVRTIVNWYYMKQAG